jgi:hypothetical protein
MNRRFIFAGFAACLLLVGAEPAAHHTAVSGDKIGDSVIVLGDLGLPVGQAVTIGGRKERAGRGRGTFLVETIDGKPTSADLHTHVTGIRKWREGTKATLRGNEVGTLRFVTIGETNFTGPEDPRWKGPHQQLFLTFDVSQVVSPAGLEVGNTISMD